MKNWLIILLPLLAACQPVQPATDGDDRAVRIVSLDYCADQYVLKLVEPARIAAVSPQADDDYSFMREAVGDLRQVRPEAESVLALEPDLIVRSYGGGPNAVAFFEAAGVPVLQLGYANTIGDVTGILREVAAGLGEEQAAAEMITAFNARLAAIETGEPPHPTALYMTAGGVTTGPGSLIDEILQRAGYENFQNAPGWSALPLERLAVEQPDVVAAAFFESGTDFMNAWSAAGHPVARRQLADSPVVRLDGAWTACGGWFLIEAIEALADARPVVPADGDT